jgi:hypothetical protein
MKVLEPSLNDEDVARLEHATFQYFADEVNLENGLVRDSTKRGSPASIAAVGFALTAYPLGLASPTFPLPAESYSAWTRTYKWKKLYGHEFVYAGPLFIHHLSHMWIDFRGVAVARTIEQRLP